MYPHFSLGYVLSMFYINVLLKKGFYETKRVHRLVFIDCPGLLVIQFFSVFPFHRACFFVFDTLVGLSLKYTARMSESLYTINAKAAKVCEQFLGSEISSFSRKYFLFAEKTSRKRAYNTLEPFL